jgi:glycosyltransferase involved in cell wall biosynthesis
MDQQAELVSVVIPSYNHRRFIGEAVDSVLRQTHANVECIVVDDGSRDGSPEYLKERYANEPRVRLSGRENRGAHNTINEAIGHARGQFISILNSDDVYADTRLERLLAAAREAKGPFFGITALEVVDEVGQPCAGGPRGYYERVCQKAAGGPPSAGFWVGNIAMTTSNFFFSREVFDTLGGFRSLRYTHDWDWALRATERYGLRRLEAPLLNYRVHGSNTIAESNIWKHVCENAFVFASALGRQGLAPRGTPDGISAPEVMAFLLRNESFLPLPTLYLRSLGRTDGELEQALADGSLESELKDLLGRSGVSLDLLLSVDHLQGLVRKANEPQAAGPLPETGLFEDGKRLMVKHLPGVVVRNASLVRTLLHTVQTRLGTRS